VNYDEVVADVVQVVEAVGCAVMVLGAVWALGVFAVAVAGRRPTTGDDDDHYTTLRRSLGRVILLGLEILIIADIIRTVIVDPTIESVISLGAIVLIRIVLSFSLEVEIDGAWPWSKWRLTDRDGSSPSGEPAAPGTTGGAPAR
jgi:uncharacterized membrane protein